MNLFPWSRSQSRISYGNELFCLFDLLLSGIVLHPFFAFPDLDIFEEYRKNLQKLFRRMSFRLSLSNISSQWDSVTYFWQKYHRDDVMPHIRRHMWLICSINRDVNFDTWLRLYLPGEFINFSCHLCYMEFETKISKHFTNESTCLHFYCLHFLLHF